MRCRTCKEDKEDSGFSLLPSGNRRKVCVPCRGRADRQTAKTTGKKKKPPTAEKQREYMLRHRYGMSSAEYDDMLQAQEGLCASCGDILDGPHVDHCHATGNVRGLLCAFCNMGLGHFFDDADRLRLAANYIERSKK